MFLKYEERCVLYGRPYKYDLDPLRLILARAVSLK